MKENRYKLDSANLIKVIDAAIKTFKKVPPLHFDEFQTLEVINLHEEWKNDIINAETKFQNLRSLKYRNEDVFTYFNEGQENVSKNSGRRLKHKVYRIKEKTK